MPNVIPVSSAIDELVRLSSEGDHLITCNAREVFGSVRVK